MDIVEQPLAISDIALGLGLIFGIPVAYLYLQTRALLSWRGWWRLAAIPPLLVMAPAIAQMVQAFRDGSNLAPIVVILIAPFAAGWLAVLAVVRARVLS